MNNDGVVPTPAVLTEKDTSQAVLILKQQTVLQGQQYSFWRMGFQQNDKKAGAQTKRAEHNEGRKVRFPSTVRRRPFQK